MRYYVLVDNATGNVEGRFSWADDRDMPADYPIDASQQIVTLIDGAGENLDVPNSCYNPNNKTFGPKLTVTADSNRIDHLGTGTTLHITYPDLSVNETATLKIDGQGVQTSITNGVASIPFSSQVVGFHRIEVESNSFYGKNFVLVEVF